MSQAQYWRRQLCWVENKRVQRINRIFILTEILKLSGFQDSSIIFVFIILLYTSADSLAVRVFSFESKSTSYRPKRSLKIIILFICHRKISLYVRLVG